MIDYEQRLREMGETTRYHRCTNNTFLDRWESELMGKEDLEFFIRNFYTWIKEFPNAVSLIMRNTDDPVAKVELLKVIDDELGNGNPLNAHYLMYDRMMSSLGEKLGVSLGQDQLSGIPILETTQQLVEGQRRLLGHDNKYIALGAMMGVEWQAYAMQGRMYEGFRNYMSLWERSDEFHETASFFYIHLGSAEKEHEEESLKAAAASVQSEHDLDELVTGFNDSLDLLGDFWQGLEDNRQQD
jgi:pyrroloquinoline quinone (PQQ) biosynthesis protein C